MLENYLEMLPQESGSNLRITRFCLFSISSLFELSRDENENRYENLLQFPMSFAHVLSLLSVSFVHNFEIPFLHMYFSSSYRKMMFKKFNLFLGKFRKMFVNAVHVE